MLPRKHYFSENVDKENTKKALTVTEKMQAYNNTDTTEATSQEDANLISSELDYPYDSSVPLEDRLHAPLLDIDFPVECYESSTPGHYHLSIERPMTWRQYRKLLHALMKAGIIEEGYYKASIKRGGSFLRRKGMKKAGALSGETAEVNPQVMSWQ